MQDDRPQIGFIVIQAASMQTQRFGATPKASGQQKQQLE
jgi:hypothetical protein